MKRSPRAMAPKKKGRGASSGTDDTVGRMIMVPCPTGGEVGPSTAAANVATDSLDGADS